MPTKVIMPQLGESVIEGTVTKWLKREGDEVAEFEPLLEVNTDKVDTEIPSPAAGTLLKILVAEDTTVDAGVVLAWIGDPGEAVPEGEAAQVAAVDKTVEIRPEKGATEPVATQLVQTTASQPPVGEPQPGRDRDLGFISPVVARIARAQHVDLHQVKGTGQGGRITKKDVLAYIETRERSPGAGAAPAWETPVEGDLFKPTELLFGAGVSGGDRPPESGVRPEPGQVLPLNPVRRAIAEHMVRSKHTSPHVTTVMEADLSKVVAHRAGHKEAFARDGANLTFTAYFVAASVAALREYPLVNSSWGDNGVVLHREINIGIATSLGEEGLIVPVIKAADSLSLLGIARQVNDLANRARGKKLHPDEVQGGTFTITNHGVSGSLFATPIINQPQCAILGVGMIQKRAVVINDAIAIRPMVYLAVTFDHRILDGALADYFLARVVAALQNWSD